MRASAEWGQRAQHCRMQDIWFRARSVDLIPADARLPIRYEELQALQAKAGVGDRADDQGTVPPSSAAG